MLNNQPVNTPPWILINGEVYVINYPIHLVNLFDFIGDKKPGLITEYNQIIAKPELTKKIILNNLDRIEFVTIVGGG